MAPAYFFEKQSIPAVWRITIFGLVTLLLGFIALMTYLTEWDTMATQDRWMMLLLLLGPISVIGFFFLRLELRLTNEGIEFQVIPLGRKRKISFSQVSELELKTGSLIRANSRIGVNRQLKKQTYNFGSRHALVVRLKSGNQIIFSTFKPRELQYFLNNLPDEIPVKNRTGQSTHPDR
jgi:hypothetical protein